MLRRRLTVAAISAIACIAGLGVSPTIAQASPKPQLSFTDQTVTGATPCGDWTFTVRVPVLTGSTEANRAKVSTWGDWMRQDLIAEANRYPDSCEYLKATLDEWDGAGTVYAGRYASMMTRWRADIAGNLKTMTLDLKTGKTVGVDTFVSDKGKVFSWAKCVAFVTVASYLRENFCPDGEVYQDTSGWRVSNRGIQVYGMGDDSFYYDPTIGWSALVRANYAKSKKYTTKRVITEEGGAVAGRSTVTVQGNLVIIRKPKLGNSPAVTEYGVRGTAKSAVVYTPAWGPSGVQVDPMTDIYDDHVFFKAKGSAKAVRFQRGYID